MELKTLLIVVSAILLLAMLGLIAYLILGGKKSSSEKNLLRASRGAGFDNPADVRERLKDDVTGKEFEKLKKSQRKKISKQQASLGKEERYFHAGLFSNREIRKFEKLRWYIMGIAIPLLGLGGASMNPTFALIGLSAGVIAGVIGPSFALDRKIKKRGEEIMFYLPLVIEQISIGVSSSLDIGPCLSRVVSMADERDNHNVVSELVRFAQANVKSGISLEEALTEVGVKSGHVELKHAFMALSSVAKHGGEISRQLQELADSVQQQRETNIEAKIKKLELEATGPVALVFCGFIIVLITGFGLQITKAFGN